jgi:uncharacterized membrane protein
VEGAVRFPFEQDELYTVDEATNLFHTRLQPGIQARPVFFLAEHPIVTHAPHTAIVLRTLPLIFGVLGLWVTWALARRVMDEQAALVAVVLAVLCPWHLYASAFGRYYSLLYFLAAAVYWRLPIAYDTDRPKDYLWALLPLLVGAWTHPSFVFPVAGAALVVMSISREGTVRWRWPSRTAWLTLWGPFLVVSALIVVAIKVLHTSTTVANGGDRGLLATLRLIPAMVDWMTPVIFAAAVAGAIVLMTSLAPERRRMGWMALIGSICMFVALFVLSFKTAIYADYGIAALPLVLVAAASTIQWIAESVAQQTRTAVLWTVTALVVVAMLPSTVSHLSDGTRFDYRGAYARIEREAPSVAVFTTPLVLQREYAPNLRAYEFPTTTTRLDSLLAKEGDVWAVTSVKRYGIIGDDTGAIAHWLRERCRQVDSYQRPRLDYRLYQVDLWRCTENPRS